MALRVAEEALLQEKVLNAGPRTPHRGRGEQGLTTVFCPRHTDLSSPPALPSPRRSGCFQFQVTSSEDDAA